MLNPLWTERSKTKFRDAAVLIPVIDRRDQPSVLMTERTSHLPSHAGQIAFPGGKIDPDDAGPAAAALREAREEVGLAADRIEVIGFLDTYLSRTGYRIVPVLGRVSADFDLIINEAEVADVFEVPLAFLLDRGNHHEGVRQFPTGEGRFYEIPYQERYIWGVTAGIIRSLANRMAD